MNMATYKPHTPDVLSTPQLRALVWPNADPSVTREMLLQCVKNRLNLGRLSVDDIARAA